MRRRFVWAAAAFLVLALAAFAITYPRVRDLSNMGAGYVALQMCSCIEVVGRTYDECLLDMLPEMEPIESERVAGAGRKGVRAWIPIYADRSAWHQPPDGCTLE